MDSNTIDTEESDYLYIQTSQLLNSGNGLFTAIEIYKEEIISIFKGEVLSDEETEIRAKSGNDAYFMNLLNGEILDCKNTDCFAKYANDASGFSKSDFKNNAKITLDDDNNVCLIALRKIKTGEEIFCDYGKRYWKKHKLK
ncbi:SET domain-containing protein-lysine N-methyltransferase [Flavobacterium sp. SUN052]|uniref:SET domain-containing protein-lysine N-methyltransferase n=1 Tax=Flavobacterium sp. SUN052 TaxID=3002441 RepID=UPI00237EC09E|nr:SET domain-containing protein-lysine N-methyltransferase [Flavobacterium sp. SUN052]MEC4005648.1 SET domain-containing protein-lysine N-methyltransferase [Flavobacterium sp. SUN052]